MRKLALTAITALAALAMTATTASAAVTVTNSAGQPCSQVSPAINKANPAAALFSTASYQSGGCTVHMSSVLNQQTIIRSSNGLYDYCYINYDLHIGPDGWGYANNVAYSGSANCSAWQSTYNSYTVLPGDVNPNGLFTQANADTAFNVRQNAHRSISGYNEFTSGYVSLDSTASAPLALQNQLAINPLKSYSGGRWTGNANITVTRN
jgi:hypothetical protein